MSYPNHNLNPKPNPNPNLNPNSNPNPEHAKKIVMSYTKDKKNTQNCLRINVILYVKTEWL